MASLTVKIGPDKGRVYPLTSERVVTFGRNPSCTINIPKSDCSREHANITAAGEGWLLSNTSANNKVLVNDKSIQQALLKDGDTIEISGRLYTCNLRHSQSQNSLLGLNLSQTVVHEDSFMQGPVAVVDLTTDDLEDLPFA